MFFLSLGIRHWKIVSYKLLVVRRGLKELNDLVCISVFPDLYHDWVAPYFNSDLLVETWQNGAGRMGSDCSGQKACLNLLINFSFIIDLTCYLCSSSYTVSLSLLSQPLSQLPPNLTCFYFS